MKILNFFVTHQVTMSMVLLATLVFGAISLSQISLDMLPDLNYPVVGIVTIYPGSDSNTIEREVTTPIEDSLGTIKGLKRLESYSQENASIVLAYLNWGTDISEAIEDINSLLRIVNMTLPSDCNPPLVLKMDSSQLPTMLIGITADMDLPDLTKMVDQKIKPVFESVPGVAQVSVLGGVRPVINIYYSTEKVREHWLTPLDISQMIGFQNLVIPAGHYEMPYLNGDNDNLIRYQIRAGNSIKTVADLENLVVGIRQQNTENGFGLAHLLPPVVYLKDVAEVREEYPQTEGLIRINNQPAVVLRVLKQSGENTVRISQGLKDVLGRLSSDYTDTHFFVITDQSDFITQSLSNLSSVAIVGGLLAVLILYLFLKNTRNLIIISVSIPFSVLIALIIMRFANMSLNLMTLGGLALGIGMLVDNSIVVLENIFRRYSQGEERINASINGTSQVSAAITSSTVTTLAVFVPLVFIQSIVGYLFRDLALSISFALIGSLLAALIVIPVLFAHLPSGSWQKKKKSNRLVESSKRIYLKILKASLRKPIYVVGIVAVLTLILIVLPNRLDTGFFPQIDGSMITIDLSLPAGTTLNDTNNLVKEIEEVCQSYNEVQSVVTYIGNQGGEDYYSLLNQAPVHSATLTLLLSDVNQRARSAHQIAEELKSALNYPGVRMRISADRAADALGDDFKMNLKLEITGSDFAVLSGLATEITSKLRGTEGFTDIFSSVEELQPELFFEVNRGQSLQATLTTTQVALSLRYAMLGLPITNIIRDGQIVEVLMRPDPEEINSYDKLLQYKISALGTGQSQPTKAASLGTITKPLESTSPPTITHVNRQRIVTVEAELAGISFMESRNRVEAILNSMDIPLGYTVTMVGIHRTIDESMSDFIFVIILAILLVYMVMASQFESFILPLLIMVLVPISGSGAVFALWITGNNLDIPALLGIVILVGIVVNNGIVLIDSINQHIKKGESLLVAIQIAADTRYRPILMTSLTTILGLLPMSIGWGEGTEIQIPMAISVIGGLFSATILTLFVIPTFYSVIESIKPNKTISHLVQ